MTKKKTTAAKRIPLTEAQKLRRTIKDQTIQMAEMQRRIDGAYETGLKPDMQIQIGDRLFVFKEVKKPWWKLWT